MKPYQGSKQDLFQQKFGKSITEYESFKRATNGLKSGTIKGYKYGLSDFFLYINEDPDTVIQNRIKDITSSDFFAAKRYEQMVKNYRAQIENKGQTTAAITNRIQGFFTNNSKRLSLDLEKLKNPDDTKHEKYSPSTDEIKQLIKHADNTRDKFIISAMYQNGILPVDLIALKIGDYPTKPWTYYKRQRSKTQKTWHGVSTPDTTHFLNEYLIIRKGNTGEPLLMGREGPLTAGSLKLMLRQLIDKSGLGENPRFIPKCLRDGFEDGLIDAKVYTKVKEAMMGHGSSIAHQYGSAKRTEQRCINAMRKAYPILCLTDNKNAELTLTDKAAQELFSLLPTIKTFFNIPEIQEILQKHLNQQPTNS